MTFEPCRDVIIMFTTDILYQDTDSKEVMKKLISIKLSKTKFTIYTNFPIATLGLDLGFSARLRIWQV